MARKTLDNYNKQDLIEVSAIHDSLHCLGAKLVKSSGKEGRKLLLFHVLYH